MTTPISPSADPVARTRADAHGLVIVNTGNGKGKTTAALGMLLRSWGRGMQVCAIQFIKNEGARFGEHLAAKKLGIELVSTGDGFTWLSKDLDHSAELAQHGWKIAQERIASDKYDLILLDEITHCFTYGWLKFSDVREWLDKNKPSRLHLVFTGRNASDDLIAYADLVTEMTLIKHPYQDCGLKAQPGVEF